MWRTLATPIFILCAVPGCGPAPRAFPPATTFEGRGKVLAEVSDAPRGDVVREAMKSAQLLLAEGLGGNSNRPELNAMADYASWSLLRFDGPDPSGKEVWFSGVLNGKPGRREFAFVAVKEGQTWKLTRFEILK